MTVQDGWLVDCDYHVINLAREEIIGFCNEHGFVPESMDVGFMTPMSMQFLLLGMPGVSAIAREVTRQMFLHFPQDESLWVGLWGNVLYHSGRIRLHNHPGSSMAVAIHLDSHQSGDGGYLCFPHHYPYRVYAEPGQVVTFPGEYQHFVSTYRGEGRRVSLAMDFLSGRENASSSRSGGELRVGRDQVRAR